MQKTITRTSFLSVNMQEICPNFCHEAAWVGRALRHEGTLRAFVNLVSSWFRGYFLYDLKDITSSAKKNAF